MRTSLNEIRDAETFLTGNMPAEDSLLFQAKMIVNPVLKDNVSLQARLMDVLRFYHRKKIRREIEVVSDRLFTSPDHLSFQEQISLMFNS